MEEKVLKYHRGCGVDGIPEKGNYIVKAGPSKDFKSLSKALDFYGEQEKEKALWTEGGLLIISHIY